MSESVTQREGRYDYTATVGDADDLHCPVVVTSAAHTVRFDGNDFATKHLRRIRSNSVSELTDGDAKAKLGEYIMGSFDKAWNRFGGREQATSTLIHLDLGQYCKFGCEVIKFVTRDPNPWQIFVRGTERWEQKHVDITIDRCFASSNSGFGPVREVEGTDRLQHGIGITRTVTVRKPPNSNNRDVQVCHYAQGVVKNEFSQQSTSRSLGWGKLQAAGPSIVSPKF